MQYWYKKATRAGLLSHGPCTLDEMRQLYRQTLLARSQQVSIDGGESWRSAGEFPELFQRPAPAPAPPTLRDSGPPPLPLEEEADGLEIDIDLQPTPALHDAHAFPAAIYTGVQADVFCRECGAGLKRRAVICPQCGVPAGEATGGVGLPGGGDKKNKYVAAMLAFLLGGFGAHHFYLGNPVLGIVYIVFCWTLIPALVAFIESIIFLAMSESSFDRKYNRALV